MTPGMPSRLEDRPTDFVRKIFRRGISASAAAAVAGMGRALRKFYQRRIRPRSPETGMPVCNGVIVATPRRLLDHIMPRSWNPDIIFEDLPLYESALVDAIRSEVRQDDTVVIVGGGYGVTLVQAARSVGNAGRIVCYEPVPRRIEDIRNAIRLNSIETPVELIRAIVGRAVALFGPGWNAPIVSPAQIPECDVLEMDCEGAEIEILEGLSVRPRAIAVETHGYLGSPTSSVRRSLEGMGYTVEDFGPAEADSREFCIERDIRVLVARMPEDAT
jgi:hypothetical protein